MPARRWTAPGPDDRTVGAIVVASAERIAGYRAETGTTRGATSQLPGGEKTAIQPWSAPSPAGLAATGAAGAVGVPGTVVEVLVVVGGSVVVVLVVGGSVVGTVVAGTTVVGTTAPMTVGTVVGGTVLVVVVVDGTSVVGAVGGTAVVGTVVVVTFVGAAAAGPAGVGAVIWTVVQAPAVCRVETSFTSRASARFSAAVSDVSVALA